MTEQAENPKIKEILKRLSLQKLKFLAKRYKVNVKGSLKGDLSKARRRVPSKEGYVDALAKHISEKDIESGLKEAPRQERRRRNRMTSEGWF